MLQIIIPAEERWDEEHEEFIVSKKRAKIDVGAFFSVPFKMGI